VSSVHTRRLAARKAATARRVVEHATRSGLSVADLRDVRLPWYEIRNQADGEDEAATVLIYDEIGGSFGTTADQFAEDLQEITAPVIHLRINSPGGSLFDALAIHSSLLHHPARVVVYVDSLAASAASVIAMAGDEVVMMPGSQMMIHDVSAVQDGNAADMARMSTFLDRQSDNVADIYRRRAGGDAAEWRALMLDETWMFAAEAVEMGLADRVQERPEPAVDERMSRSFDLSMYRYAGRRCAPAPSRRTSAGRPRTERRVPAVVSTSSDAERRDSARRRSEAARERSGARLVAKRQAPSGLSTARMAAFPAKLRATLVEHNGQQRYHLVGHASVVDRPYEMWDKFGPYMEIVDRGAFTRTLGDGPDVAFLVNHRGVTMARTTNGSLRLSMDDVGLAVEAWLNPKRQDVSDLVVAIEDRDITEMSFAFLLEDGVWSDDFETFRIMDLELHRGDVSAVNYGANPYTDVAARSGQILADLDHLPAGAAKAAVARLQAREDVLSSVQIRREQLEQSPPDLTNLAVAAAAEEPPKGRSVAHIEALLET
jgi:HK97 family phage prohead protease